MSSKSSSFLLSSFVVLLLAIIPFHSIASDNPWSGKVRPGFMAGDGDVGTDFYLDVLIPLYGDQKQLFFFNPNLRFDDNDGNEQNIGFGYRSLVLGNKYILGANSYYDTMESEAGHRYQQWGVGAELLSHWFDLRANYYNIFGDDENILSGSGGSSSYFFSGHSLMSLGGSVEQALDGFDAEVSVLVPGISDVMETRLAATYYRYDADYAKDPDGWRGRIEMRPVQAVNLSVEYRDDDLRGSDTFVGAYFEIPFSIENLLSGKNPFEGAGETWSFGKGVRQLEERMTDKVIRDRHIVAVQSGTAAGGSETPIVDDAMIFVNQDNTDETRDGSYENPWQTLDEAVADEHFQPGAWIYVFSNDETADTYTGISEFTLLDDMVFWGQGYEHPVYGLGGGDNPILEGNGGDNILHLADNNEVMGLTFQNGWNAIQGQNIEGTYIHDNIIRDNGRAGITINNNWSPTEVTNKILLYQLTNNRIVENAGDGIYLHHNVSGEGALDNLSITNIFTGNTVTGSSGNGVDVLNYLVHSGTTTGVEIVDTFANNEISNNDEHGIIAYQNYIKGTDVTDSGLTETYTGNTIEQNGWNGMQLGCDMNGGTNTWLHYSFTNNSVSGNGVSGSGDYNTNGLYIYNDPNNDELIDKSIFMQGNTITQNMNDGVRLYFLGENTDDFAGDFGGGALSSTGGNTFADNGGYDIYREGDAGVDIWALNNSWTDNNDPESTIYDKQDTTAWNYSDIITAPPER